MLQHPKKKQRNLVLFIFYYCFHFLDITHFLLLIVFKAGWRSSPICVQIGLAARVVASQPKRDPGTPTLYFLFFSLEWPGTIVALGGAFGHKLVVFPFFPIAFSCSSQQFLTRGLNNSHLKLQFFFLFF